MKGFTIIVGSGLLTVAMALPLAGQQTVRAATADKPQAPGYTLATRYDHTDLSLAELQRLLPAPKRQTIQYEVPNQLAESRARVAQDQEADPLAADGLNPVTAPMAGLSFNGPSSDDNQNVLGGRIQPPDTNGDVGREHVVSYINLVWRVFDKSGNPVGGAMPGNTFWAGFGGACENENDGDPIVVYDHLAARWVFTQFAPFSGMQCFAISDGEDPTVGFTRYAFVLEPNAFNDYPKVGVWASQDGSQSAYTYTGRNFIPQASPAFARDITAVLFDRDAMLGGGAAGFTTAVAPGGFGTWDALQPGHIDNLGAAPGDACPLFSVADGTTDDYRFFEFCENFPGAGSFTTLPVVSVPNFDDGLGDVPQPVGDTLDTLAFFTMYRASHRNLGGDHRLAMAHTVDAGGDRAGMRWAILDVDNYNAISLVDTGTYAPPDGLERWMGSVTLDQEGNLGMGYTRGGGGQFASVYYTGRETTDPAGQLQTEVTCVDGTGAQTGGAGRWGDYSATSIDPEDGCTFWTFQEYVQMTGNFEWNTRICSFSFPSCTGIVPMDFTLSVASPGTAGVNNTWTTTNGNPSTRVLLYFGRPGATTTVTVGGCTTTLDVGNARVMANGFADAGGTAMISRFLPARFAGRTLNFQAVDLAPCENSNVQATTFN